MQKFHVNGWQLWFQSGSNLTPPAHLLNNASRVVELGDHTREPCRLFIGVANDNGNATSPELIIWQSYNDARGIFPPGFLVIPETSVMFVGAGEYLSGYDLRKRLQIFQDRTECGFFSWNRHGDTVLMSGELELAAWSTHGEKRWSRFVEPPWSFEVDEEHLTLDVMGKIQCLGLSNGRPIAS